MGEIEEDGMAIGNQLTGLKHRGIYGALIT